MERSTVTFPVRCSSMRILTVRPVCSACNLLVALDACYIIVLLLIGLSLLLCRCVSRRIGWLCVHHVGWRRQVCSLPFRHGAAILALIHSVGPRAAPCMRAVGDDGAHCDMLRRRQQQQQRQWKWWAALGPGDVSRPVDPGRVDKIARALCVVIDGSDAGLPWNGWLVHAGLLTGATG